MAKRLKGSLSGLRKFLATDNLLKRTKMLFTFTVELFSFSRYLKFCLDFLVMNKNGLIKKIWLIWKFLTEKPEKQTIAIHILRNISTSKSNSKIRFGQLIQHNRRKIFLKNQSWAYLWINILHTVCFYCMPNWLLSKYNETKLQNTSFYVK